jgi:hypothetical protein
MLLFLIGLVAGIMLGYGGWALFLAWTYRGTNDE